MELYASGFNAWGQLQFQATESHAEPDDLHEFTCVLTGDAIDRPRPSLSYTTVAVNGKVRTAGYLPTAHRQLWDEDFLSKCMLAEASNGSVAVLDQSGSVRRYQSLDGFLSQDEYQTFPRLPPCQQLVAYETGFAALTAQAMSTPWAMSGTPRVSAGKYRQLARRTSPALSLLSRTCPRDLSPR
ncbi:hypothetical protein FJTKL_00624 [Diaporthe vaccinii]|uniref:Uncharacterized protein n=1 Tax=Diaporthe vaccinii TaxID=105482 RepID=A0ABR4F622_9PEZI